MSSPNQPCVIAKFGGTSVAELAEILADRTKQNLLRTAEKQEQILAILNQSKLIA